MKKVIKRRLLRSHPDIAPEILTFDEMRIPMRERYINRTTHHNISKYSARSIFWSFIPQILREGEEVILGRGQACGDVSCAILLTEYCDIPFVHLCFMEEGSYSFNMKFDEFLTQFLKYVSDKDSRPETKSSYFYEEIFFEALPRYFGDREKRAFWVANRNYHNLKKEYKERRYYGN